MRELLEVDISFIPRKIISASEMLSPLARYAGDMMTGATNKLGVARVLLCLVALLLIAMNSAPSNAESFNTIPRCRYSLDGVIDLHGREIIPCKYKSIKDLGAGLIGAREYAPGGEQYHAPMHVFNFRGKEIEIDLPEDFVLVNVFFIREPATPSSKDLLEKLPADALLEVRRDRDYRLLTMDGFAVLDNYDYPLCRYSYEKYVVFQDLRTVWFSRQPYQCWMFLVDPLTGRKIYSGPEIERIKSQRDADQLKYPNTEQITGKDFDGKTFICSVCGRGRADVSDGFSWDGWNCENAIVFAFNRKGNREREYGIANRKRELTVIPMYSQLIYLFDDVYLAQTSKGSTAFLINGQGKKLPTPLPAGTFYSLCKGGVILCEQGEGLPELLRKFSVYTRTFEPIVTSAKGTVSSFYKGVVLSYLCQAREFGVETSYDVTSKDGTLGTGIRADHLEVLNSELLIKSELQPESEPEKPRRSH